MSDYNNDLERGLHMRRQMLGDAWVDKSLANATDFSADFQNLITRFAWNEIWNRPGLAPKTRRIVVLVSTAVLGRWDEFELHLRAALNARDADAQYAGLSADEVKEVLLQIAAYAGVPVANTGMAATVKVMRELGMDLPTASVFDARQAGQGRSFMSAASPSLHYSVRESSLPGAPRQTIVLGHALGTDLSLWDALAGELVSDNRVVCIDHRGHGRSETPPGPYDMTALAEDAALVLREVVQGFDSGPVVWVGMSMGGMVGQELALRHPRLLKALVIANASSGYPAEGRAMWRERIAGIESQGIEGVADGVMQRWLSPAFHARHPAQVARWRRRLVSTSRAGYLGGCHAVMNMDTTQRLGQIELPTLVIAGALDQATPPSMSEVIARQIPGARLEVITGAAHLSVLEDMPRFASLLRGFIGGLA